MEIDDKIKTLAQEGLFGVKKLIRFGSSYGITLPRIWVKMNCTEIEGEYYLNLRVEGNNIIFSSIEPADIEKITIRKKEK